jgi:hypothetical protein
MRKNSAQGQLYGANCLPALGRGSGRRRVMKYSMSALEMLSWCWWFDLRCGPLVQTGLCGGILVKRHRECCEWRAPWCKVPRGTGQIQQRHVSKLKQSWRSVRAGAGGGRVKGNYFYDQVRA